MRLRVQIPQVEPGQYQPWPKCCPACGNATFQSRSFGDKPLRDIRFDQVRPQRIPCTEYGHTLRVYPKGGIARDQSERVRALSILLWLLGIVTAG